MSYRYLKEPVPLTAEVLPLAGPAEPREVFRIAADCEESRCTHFDGSECRLATRIVQILPAVVSSLPVCLIRGIGSSRRPPAQDKSKRAPARSTSSSAVFRRPVSAETVPRRTFPGPLAGGK